MYFYSRAPCGTRLIPIETWCSTAKFLLTRPMRDATVAIYNYTQMGVDFYSRAPCGTRPFRLFWKSGLKHFYSRAPCGTRQMVDSLGNLLEQFLLTRPMRDATSGYEQHIDRSLNFYSRAPCGTRLFMNLFATSA